MRIYPTIFSSRQPAAKWVSTVALLLCAWASMGQPDVAVVLDTNRLLVGDQTTLHLRAKYAQGQRVALPDLAAYKLQGIEIIGIAPPDTLTRNPFFVEQAVIITSFDSGVQTIPRLAFGYGEGDTVYSDPLLLTVSTLPIADTAYIAPLKPIAHEPLALADLLPLFWVLLAVAVVVGGWWWYRYRRNQPKVVATPPPPPLPPHQIALQKLDALEQAQLWQQGEVKQYQTELTYILREYIENRFAILALESTTAAIQVQLQQFDLPLELRTKINDILNIADLVKFAKALPPDELHQGILADARYFVNQTMPTTSEPTP